MKRGVKYKAEIQEGEEASSSEIDPFVNIALWNEGPNG
jgi:hypothetical protein